MWLLPTDISEQSISAPCWTPVWDEYYLCVPCHCSASNADPESHERPATLSQRMPSNTTGPAAPHNPQLTCQTIVKKKPFHGTPPAEQCCVFFLWNTSQLFNNYLPHNLCGIQWLIIFNSIQYDCDTTLHGITCTSHVWVLHIEFSDVMVILA